jgi:hypothetical protein
MFVNIQTGAEQCAECALFGERSRQSFSPELVTLASNQKASFCSSSPSGEPATDAALEDDDDDDRRFMSETPAPDELESALPSFCKATTEGEYRPEKTWAQLGPGITRTDALLNTVFSFALFFF